MTIPTLPSTLALRHVPPGPYAIEPWTEVRPLVDGRDVLADIHPDGVSSCSARDWVRPPGEWPLSAPEEPREVELSNNNCHTDCCGGVFVTIRREGDRVVWSSWRNTNDTRVPVPAEVRFDAAEYDAELARAAADKTWEEPVDTVARLTATELTDSGWFERWDCVLENVSIVREEPLGVEVYFSQRMDRPARSNGPRFAFELPVTRDEPAEAQARRFIDLIMADDPRETADRF
ncbi:hypothetical protein [Streptomyces sp. NPDC093795]|uniref:hypothetical protein n=1 Tax=Streptomyces sp. NPDC093795 TaxID=3366051 RepID=UPI00382BA017